MRQALTPDMERRLATRQYLEGQAMQAVPQAMVPSTYVGPGGQPRVGNLVPSGTQPMADISQVMRGSIGKYLSGTALDPQQQAMNAQQQVLQLQTMQQNLAGGEQRLAMGGLGLQEKQRELQGQEAAANFWQRAIQTQGGVGGGVLTPAAQAMYTSPVAQAGADVYRMTGQAPTGGFIASMMGQQLQGQRAATAAEARAAEAERRAGFTQERLGIQQEAQKLREEQMAAKQTPQIVNLPVGQPGQIATLGSQQYVWDSGKSGWIPVQTGAQGGLVGGTAVTPQGAAPSSPPTQSIAERAKAELQKRRQASQKK
jgi:hypothetical protein